MTYHFHGIAIFIFITMANEKVSLAKSFVIYLKLYICRWIESWNWAHTTNLVMQKCGSVSSVRCTPATTVPWTFAEKILPLVGSPLEIANHTQNSIGWWSWPQLQSKLKIFDWAKLSKLLFYWKIRNFPTKSIKTNICFPFQSSPRGNFRVTVQRKIILIIGTQKEHDETK